MSPSTTLDDRLARLKAVLDGHRGHYKELAGATDFAGYLASRTSREDEEILTEPILAELIESLFGFPKDAYFPQLGRSGLKPDFTPMDQIAHPFVLDAKSTTQDLAHHESQIRSYIDQRQLDYGLLFNLKEFRVYRRGQIGEDPARTVRVEALWRAARGESILTPDEEHAFERLVGTFSFREMQLEQKIELIQNAAPWSQRETRKDALVDIDFLVEKLRDESRTLVEDVEAQQEELREHLRLSPGRERALLKELEVLALDLAPGTAIENLPGSVDGYIDAPGLEGRVWHQYTLRVAQLALARIVLYRSWEDGGFVQSYLYDGGFGQAYEQLGRSLRELIDQAFAAGGQRYHWLFGSDNNYDWYRPRDETLVDVLYALTPFPLSKLDADVLGGLYESYVDEIDRDRLGQFYTPRAVVKFMLDRAGFSGPDGVFEIEGDTRGAKKIYDFATGSGGFLVEAARRVVEEGAVDEDDASAIQEALGAIVNGFHGTEISPFPYYLTEINLLLQVSRLLGMLRAAGKHPTNFALSVVHADSLSGREVGASSIEGMEADQRGDRGELVADERFGLVPLDAEKQEAFRRLRANDSFDLVVGNPPYVFETNNKVLFERLRGIESWKQDYKGKSDYLYYFLTLAAEKAKPGGRLCVITPAGWMNAGNADWLRARLADSLTIDELFLFGSYRLFAPEREARGRRHRAPTPTVESAILVATKAPAPTGHKFRVVALEDELEAAGKLAGREGDRIPDRIALLNEMARRAGGRQGRRDGIHVHDVRQDRLVASRPWPIKHSAKDVPTRAVAALQAKLDSTAHVEPLRTRWHVYQGIQTGADAYTPRVQKRLAASFPDEKKLLDARGKKPGEPILELPRGTAAKPPWSEHPDLLATSIEPHAVLYGALDEAQATSLVWIDRSDAVPPEIIEALSAWKPALEKRAEFVRNASRRWFETAWPRSKEEMRRPKVIALYRTDRGRFALDEEGAWQPSIKTTIATPTEDGLSVAYLCGLLNSELLDLWYGVRGKTPRDVWRNYEPKPMNEIPYRHVPQPEPTDGSRLEDLAEALASRNLDSASGMVDDIARAVRADPDDAAEAAAAVEMLVRSIAANRQELLPLRPRFKGLERVVKDPWRTSGTEPDLRGFVEALPASDAVSVRLDSSLEVSIETDGPLGKPSISDKTIEFRRQRKTTASVSGRSDRIGLLGTLVGTDAKLLPADLQALTLPKSVDVLQSVVMKESARADELLADGRILVELVEQIVCALYEIPADLTAEVIAHAVARAQARPSQPDADAVDA
jgi:hypothetical protein